MTSEAFRKERSDAPLGYFACEAMGLRWLAVPGGPRLVRVLAVQPGALDLEVLEPVNPTPGAAHDLGAALARLHDTGAPAFGAAPEGWDADGFFGPLEQPLPLPSGAHASWGEFFAERRVDQVRSLLEERGRLDPETATALERLSERLRAREWDDGDSPARVHGDLWSGNVVWTDHGAVLVDPAAHGGHRLADLAMLHLFGLPYLDELVAGYGEVHPLPDGWQDLLGLHQVYPVGMHAVLFGGDYVGRLGELARRYA
jgi:fructosamine-3-kinase